MTRDDTNTRQHTSAAGERSAEDEAAARRRRRRRLLLAAVPVVVILAAGAGVWWFVFRDDSPPRATTEDLTETLDEQSGGEGASGADIAGTWTVDPAVGTPGEPGGTFAGYRIQEEFASIGASEAVGRTGDVSGEITIDDKLVTAAQFEVDMTSLRSDDERRDDRLRSDGLETDTYQTATFTLTEPLELPEDATSGQELSYSAVGELELHGQTQEVTVELDAALENDTVGILANAPIVLADYGIEKPSSPAIVSIADQGEFELGVFLTRS